MIPARLLSHTVTLVTPTDGTADPDGNARSDYGDAAERTEMQAWLQQDDAAEADEGDRDARERTWLMITNDDPGDALGLVEWDGMTFDVQGPPAPYYRPGETEPHHYETQLRLHEG